MTQASHDEIRSAVRDAYGLIALGDTTGADGSGSCCGTETTSVPVAVASMVLGYSEADLSSVPAGADLGLGCGNPTAIASLSPGDTVLDLGSGAGFDAFLAARAVGSEGRVIGVDMTPDMVSKARANASRGGYGNVDFRLGEIEHLPVADATIDVIISNCVINLSPDKPAVFREAFRVLTPGGRLAIADIVATAPMPEQITGDVSLYACCVGGASLIDDLRAMMAEAGFTDIRITPKDDSREFIEQWATGRGTTDYVVSAIIEAVKPRV